MAFAPKQLKPTYLQFDQPKFTARTRFHQTTSSALNHQDKQKSISKSSSIKYIKQLSPKRNHKSISKSNSKNVSNKILKLLDRYEQTLNNQNKQNHSYQDNFEAGKSQNNKHLQLSSPNCSKLGQALKSIDLNSQRNCQTTRLSNEKQKKQYRLTLKQNMLEKFQSNEAKIILMRQNLEKIFTTYKERERQLTQMKSNMKNEDKVKSENQFLTKQITRVQQMIKEALLQRQKLKHGPFSQLTKRNKK